MLLRWHSTPPPPPPDAHTHHQEELKKLLEAAPPPFVHLGQPIGPSWQASSPRMLKFGSRTLGMLKSSTVAALLHRLSRAGVVGSLESVRFDLAGPSTARPLALHLPVPEQAVDVAPLAPAVEVFRTWYSLFEAVQGGAGSGGGGGGGGGSEDVSGGGPSASDSASVGASAARGVTVSATRTDAGSCVLFEFTCDSGPVFGE